MPLGWVYARAMAATTLSMGDLPAAAPGMTGAGTLGAGMPLTTCAGMSLQGIVVSRVAHSG